MTLLSNFPRPLFSQAFTSSIVIPISISTIIFLYLVKTRRCRGLNSVPGPFLASLTNLYRFLDAWGRQCHDTQLKLHGKYGKFVRYGTNMVSISDPDAIPIIYSLAKGFVKSEYYDVYGVVTKGIMTQGMFDTRDEVYHRSIRKPVDKIYALPHAFGHEPSIDSTTLALIARLTSLYADEEKICDFGKWLQWYAFDAIGQITFSRRLGFIDSGKDVDGIISSIKRQVDYASVVSHMPWLDLLLEKNFILNKIRKYTNPISKFTLARIQERLAEIDAERARVDRGEAPSDTHKVDMLSEFIAVRMKDPEKVSEYFVLSWAINNCLASSDTMGVTLSALFYHLLKNPETLTKVRSEIDAVGGLLSYPTTWGDMIKMPYLGACITETLRIHPAVSIVLERVVPKGGIEICGKFFEEGTIVGANPWVVHRDKGVFGNDADKWNPDRWLTLDENRQRMERSLLTFGGGSRICLGRHIASLEMCKIVPQLLRTFDIELAYPEKEWKLRNNVFIHQVGFFVKLKKRVPSL